MRHVTSYPASAWRSRLCRRAVRVKSGRMASRLLSRPQWAAMRSGVTMTTGSTAEGSSCWESGEITESLVSVSLWPVRHINRQQIEMPRQRFTHCVNHICLGLKMLWPHSQKKKSQTEVKYQRTMFCFLNCIFKTRIYTQM